MILKESAVQVEFKDVYDSRKVGLLPKFRTEIPTIQALPPTWNVIMTVSKISVVNQSLRFRLSYKYLQSR